MINSHNHEESDEAVGGDVDVRWLLESGLRTACANNSPDWKAKAKTVLERMNEVNEEPSAPDAENDSGEWTQAHHDAQRWIAENLGRNYAMGPMVDSLAALLEARSPTHTEDALPENLDPKRCDFCAPSACDCPHKLTAATRHISRVGWNAAADRAHEEIRISRIGWNAAIDRACEEIQERRGSVEVHSWISALRVGVPEGASAASVEPPFEIARAVARLQSWAEMRSTPNDLGWDGIAKDVERVTLAVLPCIGHQDKIVCLQACCERQKKEADTLLSALNTKERERREHRDTLQAWADRYAVAKPTGKYLKQREADLWEACGKLGLRVPLVAGPGVETDDGAP